MLHVLHMFHISAVPLLMHINTNQPSVWNVKISPVNFSLPFTRSVPTFWTSKLFLVIWCSQNPSLIGMHYALHYGACIESKTHLHIWGMPSNHSLHKLTWLRNCLKSRPSYSFTQAGFPRGYFTKLVWYDEPKILAMRTQPFSYSSTTRLKAHKRTTRWTRSSMSRDCEAPKHFKALATI